jgi:multiple sugar transport system permease protein
MRGRPIPPARSSGAHPTGPPPEVSSVAIIEDTVVSIRRTRPKSRPSASRREAAWGLIFLSPWLIGLAVFTAIPILASLVLSMTDFNIVAPDRIHFVFLNNYLWAASDNATLNSIYVTLKFAAVSIPVTVGVALAIAMLVNHRLLMGKRVLRTLFFIPVQIPITASVFMWVGFLVGTGGLPIAQMQTYSQDFGTFLSSLPLVGALAPYWPTGWFTDGTWALPVLILMGVWTVGNMTLIFLAGLQGVPTELYEAAKVDGAGPWRTFLNVTLPMISPMMFYNLLLSIIATAGYFTQAYVLGGSFFFGGPQIDVYNFNLYTEAWTYNSMGRGCALAWMMFAVVIAVAILLFRTASRWVYYAGGDR